MRIQENQTYTVLGAAHGGDGIVRAGGTVCFVQGALPGDTVRLTDITHRHGAWRARVAEVVAPSAERVAPGCPVFGRCGGCNWLNFAYPGQATAKQGIVKDCFRRIAGCDIDPGWIEEPALRTGYRTRATLHASDEGWGFYELESRRVVPITKCPLAHPVLNESIARLETVENDCDLTLTVDPDTGEALAWAHGDPGALSSAFPDIQSGSTGGSRRRFEFDGVPIVNGTFSQSSLLLNRLLRARVRDSIGDASSILDLYCGSGNFSIEHCDGRHVIGMDGDGPAIMAALHASGGDYRVGNDRDMAVLCQERVWDIVILDPPRAGAKRVVKALAQSRNDRAVYVSCDPATLARDAKTLLSSGWRIDAVDVVDMFPNTAHVECVALFVRA